MAFGDLFYQQDQGLTDFSNALGQNPASTSGGMVDAASKMLSNPTFQLMLANAGGAMAPKDFAGQFASGLRPMISSRAMADAIKSMQAQNRPAQAQVNVNPMDKAKELSTASSLLKKAAELSPDVVPGFSGMLKSAADMSPQAFAVDQKLAPNPTVPAGSAFAEQVPAGVQQAAQPFSFDLSPDLAGAMTPEQVLGLYAYGSAQKKQELDIQKQINENLIAPLQRGETAARADYLSSAGRLHSVEARLKEWELTPEGREWAIKKVTAPVEAQAIVDQKKRDFSIAAVKDLLGANSNERIPGFPLTVGQMATLGAISPYSGDTIANVFTSLARIREAAANHAAVNARLQADKAALEEQRAMANLARLDARVNDLIKRPSETDFPNTPEGKSALALARMNGQVRTKEQEAEIAEIQRQRQAITAKIPGLVYTPVPVTGVPAGGKEVVADPAKLDAIKKEVKRGLPTESPLQNFIDMFNPANPTFRGL